MMSCRHIIAIDIASVRENLEELHNHMAVRANQEAALELIKSALKGKPHAFGDSRILLLFSIGF